MSVQESCVWSKKWTKQKDYLLDYKPTEIKVSHLGSGDHHFKSGFVGTEFTGVQDQWNEIIWVSRILLFFTVSQI